MNNEVLKQKAVGHARWLARQYGARGVVVLVFDGERVAGASYGETKAECKKLGKVLDGIVDELQLEGPSAWNP
jgi:hypothetical protein